MKVKVLIFICLFLTIWTFIINSIDVNNYDGTSGVVEFTGTSFIIDHGLNGTINDLKINFSNVDIPLWMWRQNGTTIEVIIPENESYPNSIICNWTVWLKRIWWSPAIKGWDL